MYRSKEEVLNANGNVVFFNKTLSNIHDSEFKIIIATIIIYSFNIFILGLSSGFNGRNLVIAMLLSSVIFAVLMITRALFIPTFNESMRCG